jgi:hypothetical protein
MASPLRGLYEFNFQNLSITSPQEIIPGKVFLYMAGIEANFWRHYRLSWKRKKELNLGCTYSEYVRLAA